MNEAVIDRAAAAVFDHGGSIIATFALVAPVGVLDIITDLTASAAALSGLLGASTAA